AEGGGPAGHGEPQTLIGFHDATPVRVMPIGDTGPSSASNGSPTSTKRKSLPAALRGDTAKDVPEITALGEAGALGMQVVMAESLTVGARSAGRGTSVPTVATARIGPSTPPSAWGDV